MSDDASRDHDRDMKMISRGHALWLRGRAFQEARSQGFSPDEARRWAAHQVEEFLGHRDAS
jgi:hypothetical protein